jgi:hypothetical protein
MKRAHTIIAAASMCGSLLVCLAARAEGPAPPPDFYVVPDTRLGSVGKGLFLGSYALAAFIPTAILFAEVATDGQVNKPPVLSVLPNYIPLVGPFITLSTSGAHTDYGTVFYTIASIPGQLLGAGLWGYSIARPSTRLVPNDATPTVAFVSFGPNGLAIAGRF